MHKVYATIPLSFIVDNAVDKDDAINQVDELLSNILSIADLDAFVDGSIEYGTVEEIG